VPWRLNPRFGQKLTSPVASGANFGVAIRLRRPTTEQLSPLLDRWRHESLTYSPVGVSLTSETPDGLRRHAWNITLPAGAFDAGADAIRSWSVHRGAGLVVATDGELVEGVTVVMSAPMPVGFVDLACRVVAVIDETDRFGFAYGTLPMHAERGEESFVISRTSEGAVFEVRAASSHAHPVTRALPAIGDRLQDAAVKRYLVAMQRAVAGGS
jgi:uncharacterized protein (UPF0548 family)